MTEENFEEPVANLEEEGFNEEFPLDSGGNTYIISDSASESEMEIDIDTSAQDQVDSVIHTYNAYFFGHEVHKLTSSRFYFSIPRSFLPLSQQAVYGFTCHENLLDVTIELQNYDWTNTPSQLEFKHPVFGNNFIGRPLVQTVFSNFFSKFYKPKKFYQAQNTLLLMSADKVDQTKLEKLKAEGYNPANAQNALCLCHNNTERALLYLKTGTLYINDTSEMTPISETIEFNSCPLLYLVLEIGDAFLDLASCCCICRKKLLSPGVKPSICNDRFCQFRLTEIGIGNSVYSEIKRDPAAADLVLTIFAATIGTKFMTPAPEREYSPQELLRIFKTLPKTTEMATRFKNDQELATAIGEESYSLLRWVLLSNLSFLMSLPQKFYMSKFPSTKQFLSLISTPEAEQAFDELGQKYGKIFQWHGSSGDRWHSILRNGLKNATGTFLQQNGSALGEGIYFAPDSGTSWGYSRSVMNNYSNSSFGKQFSIIGLCEVAKVPDLKDHGWARTLRTEKATVVRFLFVQPESTGGSPFGVNVVNDPPKTPSLMDILEYHAQTAVQH